MINMQCPMCDAGILCNKRIQQSIYGVCLGEFPAEACNKCGETFTDSETTQKIEDAAKGVWALGANTKITKTGNSLAVRIPKKIAEFLKIEDGTEVYIHPEKNKLVVEAR